MTVACACGLLRTDEVTSCVTAQHRLPGGFVLFHFLPHNRQCWASRWKGPQSSCRPAVTLPRFQWRIRRRKRNTWVGGGWPLLKPFLSPLTGSCNSTERYIGRATGNAMCTWQSTACEAAQLLSHAADADIRVQWANGYGECGTYPDAIWNITQP